MSTSSEWQFCLDSFWLDACLSPLVWIVVIGISYWSLHNIHCRQNKINNHIKAFTTCSLICQCLSNTFRCIGDFACVFASSEIDRTKWSFYNRLGWVYCISLALYFLIALFIKRLKVTFDTSQYAIPNTLYYSLIILDIIYILLTTIEVTIIVQLNYSEPVFIAFGVAAAGIFMITSIITLYGFVWRMTNLATIVGGSHHRLPLSKINTRDRNRDTKANGNTKGGNDNNNVNRNPIKNSSIDRDDHDDSISISQINKRQSQLLKIMAKNSVLVWIAVVSTILLVILVSCAVVLMENTDLQSNILFIIAQDLMLIDNVINPLCLAMQFPFAKTIYGRMCGICDEKCQAIARDSILRKQSYEYIQQQRISKLNKKSVEKDMEVVMS